MKIQLIATVALITALTTTSASAVTHKSGVVKSVNLTNNSFVMTSKGGREAEYRLDASTRVIIDGKQGGFEALAPNQEVTVAIPSSDPQYIRATILEVDRVTGLALVKPLRSKEVITIRVDENTKIGGKINSKEELSEGQTIKMRYAANI